MIRLRSDFWVSAHLRRLRGHGVDAVLRRRGAAEAGAIFVSADRQDGTGDLYGPAPQAALSDDVVDRLFVQILSAAPREALAARMEREVRFDPDLWWLEVDDRLGRTELTLVPAEPAP